MKKILSLLAVAAIGGSLQAQEVTFTTETGFLAPVAGASSVALASDMNGDLLDDVVRIASGNLHIDYQQTDGTFLHESWSVGAIGGLWSIAAADLNEDGHLDVCLGGGQRVQFLVSANGGTSWTVQSPQDYIFSQRSTFNDIDNDGDVDAFVCHDIDLSHPYRNDGTGIMTEDQSMLPTLDEVGNYHNVWCDIDLDGDQDLYISKCSGGAQAGSPRRINLLYLNNGDGTFTEDAGSRNMNSDDQSWVTVFEDFDNDGDFDAFTVNHAWSNSLMENDGTGHFTEIISTSGINPGYLGAWELDARDFNNDGYMDLISEMNQRLYLNNGDLTFTPAAENPSFDEGAIGDFNNDGFMDLTRGSTVYWNDGNATNNYIKFGLKGIYANTNGIGAKVIVNGSFGSIMKEVRSGAGSFSHGSTMMLNFGIGTATEVTSVVVKWPSGTESVYNGLSINETHELVETCAIVQVCPPDLAKDGTINTQDLLILIGKLGTSGCVEDLDGDFDVDTADLLNLVTNLGADCE